MGRWDERSCIRESLDALGNGRFKYTVDACSLLAKVVLQVITHSRLILKIHAPRSELGNTRASARPAPHGVYANAGIRTVGKMIPPSRTQSLILIEALCRGYEIGDESKMKRARGAYSRNLRT